MAGNSAWQRMERLLEHGFTHETLLEEMMHALSTYEADAIFDHIERMHGIGDDEEDEESEEEEDEDDDWDEDDIDDSDIDHLLGLDNTDNEE